MAREERADRALAVAALISLLLWVLNSLAVKGFLLTLKRLAGLTAG
jgi:hypothetical protein